MGGNRQIAVRDGHSQGLSAAAIDTVSGKLQLHATATAPEQTLNYGSSITLPFASGTPAPLNLVLRTKDEIVVEITQLTDLTTTSGVVIVLESEALGTASANFTATAPGRFTVPLSSFAGMTPQFAADIDGIRFIFGTRATNQALGLHIDSISVFSPANPMRAMISQQAANVMRLELLDASANTTYVLLRSSDLQTWSVLNTVTTDAAGEASYTDAAAPSGKSFYQFKTAEFGSWTFFQNVPNHSVAQRISELEQAFPAKQWRWVNTGSTSNIESRDIR